MQLPSVDRQTAASTGAEAALSSVGRVLPVAPVNPAASPAPEAPQGVVNRIGEGSNLATAADAGYRGLSEASARSAEQATAPQDWTIQRPEPEKVEEPPKEPISKLLLDFLQAVWRASAGAVEIAQTQNQNPASTQNDPSATAGPVARESVTYSPSKVRRNDRV